MNKEADDLIAAFVAEGGNARDWVPVYSIAPTDPAPIVRERMHDGTVTRNVDLASWGLKPPWSKPGGPAPINARLESVASNGMFRGAFAGQRCIVPMNGYYEWQARPDGKQPYFLHADADLLAAAGLYSARKEGDDWSITFTVITREARDASGEVHDRMPVFLPPDVWDDWLRPDKITAPDEALGMLDRASTSVASSIRSHPVDRAVNNVRTVDREDPRVIAPVGR
jgi:putative SOS response-associated peptidase YedK